MTALKSRVKSKVLELSMSALEILCLRYIKNNPWCRMCEISRGCLSSVDHKQMLASIVVKRLVEQNKVLKIQPVKTDRFGKVLRNPDGKAQRYKHFVYVDNIPAS